MAIVRDDPTTGPPTTTKENDMTNTNRTSLAITNDEDIIDSRDVIERIEFLLENEGDLEEEELAECLVLVALAKDAGDYSEDWEHGEALIRSSYFEDYARDMADDCGLVDPVIGWPMNCIDWEQAARELAMDYTTVDFGGVEYLIR